MKTIAIKKYWKYIFWLGPILAVMGLSASIVSGWGAAPLGLLISGIVLIGLWLVVQSQQSNWWGRRSTKAGTNAIAATLAVLVILGLINFLGVRYSTRVDLTENQILTLAPQSRELVRSLQQPVKVWVFDRNQNAQDTELLENYQRQGRQFSFEYVDPEARPAQANKFGVKDFGEVYLEAGEKRQLVQSVNNEQRLSEIELTNELQKIISDRITKVYFLQGHGERPLSQEQSALTQALSALAEKNYTTEPLNLAQQPAIPKDATVVVVAGAKRSLLDKEVKVLNDYLKTGGSLLLMIDPSTNLGIDSLLKNWGVTLDNSLAIDPASAGLGPAVPIITEYGEHPITKGFGNGISFYRGARPIEIAPVAGVQATPLLITNPQSWAESDLENQELKFNPESDRNGPLTLGVALSRQNKVQSQPQQPQPSSSPTPSATTPTNQLQPQPSPTPITPQESNKKPTQSRLVILGNSDFATDGVFEQQLNGDVFLNSVSWLSKQDEQLLSIRPKEPKNRRINLTPQQANILGLTALLFVPLIGFGAAGILWWQRR